ncbi:FHF complex subunit HOOK-interacting protein 1A [Rhinichthys klamathensis goyatoka]|uniref:FHF complex subunit HOOK-interacting protein 1A n=1 Tax=Rhinichthys klamathensis goyatoka TaxID=3034132 RepID=UPI0024B50926|nr:FHF complex subunit HOOK-interacting protein 1A [Rhinichthys klamathensis goyatoka]
MLVSSSNGGRALTLKGVDPETCMIVFKNHWTQVLRILEKHDPGRGGGVGLRFGPIPGDEASAVQNYVEHMLFLLMEEESGQAGAMGTILEFVVVENVMEKLFLWSLRREFTDDMKLEQLRMYKMLLAQAKQPLLHHKPILKPLMMLLSACSSSSTVGPTAPGKSYSSSTVGPTARCKSYSSSTMGPTARCKSYSSSTLGPTAPGKGGSSATGPTCTMGPTVPGKSYSSSTAELVSLLHQLCRVLVKEASVLELFFHSSQDQGAANFLLFSLLIPFIHRDGTVGTQARDALTLIMSLSSQNGLVAKHIVENTYFCPVLATGLSGLYSGLPAKLEVYSDGWFCLEKHDWLQVPALFQFLNSLHFCCTVCKVAHPSIRDQLLGYIYNGFLVPVMAPALHKLTLEEVMTTTAYLDLFLRSISDSALLQTFLFFILRHRHDNVNILDTLVSRINTPFQLGTVSLALFRTLIGLYCEDVMLQLILRYLIPCSHLTCAERHRLRERDCYSITASSLLSLTPSFFIPKPSLAPPPKPDYILWSKVTEGLLRGNMGMEDLFSGGDSVGFSRIPSSEPLMDKNYLHYLYDGRRAVCVGVQACVVWSNPYDGLNPSPDEYEEEDESLPLSTQTHTPHAASETSERVELEWDDTYDASPDEEPIPENMIPDEPPKHIQEMRKSAIMLIKGSYIEESDFQDDVLVYNLIAQKDARDDRRISVKNGLNKLAHANHMTNDANPVNYESEPLAFANGFASEEPNLELEAEANNLAEISIESKTPADDFISQCLELIRDLGGGEEEEEEEEEEHERWMCEEEEEEDFSSLCDDHKDEDDEEPSRNHSGKHGISFTGPFISVLLSRLENMLENSIEVNLLVTGLLAHLASFPQPLLRGFLLNTRPGRRSLYQVLQSVCVQIEQHAASRPDFPELVREAAQYLLLKDQALKEQERDAHLQDNNSTGWLLNGLVPGRPRTPLPPCPRIPPALRHRVFATFLFAEFLKELAAIAQEHAIVPEE